MPKGDQLTGGTKDVNPHYRTVNVSRSASNIGVAWNAGASGGQTAFVDLTSIDTGIAQNVPAGRGGKQIVMELLEISYQASSLLDADAEGPPNILDATFSALTFGAGNHWIKTAISEAIVISSAPLPVASGAVDATGPTVIAVNQRKLITSFGFSAAPILTGIQENLNQQYAKKIDLTDEAGHGLLIAGQKLYLYAGSFARIDFEVAAANPQSLTMNDTYSWNIDLQYRWKEVPEAEYLQILIENTIVN